MSEKCPKCGADELVPRHRCGCVFWACGSRQNRYKPFDESCNCLRRQLAAMTAERDRLWAACEAFVEWSVCDDEGLPSRKEQYDRFMKADRLIRAALVQPEVKP